VRVLNYPIITHNVKFAVSYLGLCSVIDVDSRLICIVGRASSEIIHHLGAELIAKTLPQITLLFFLYSIPRFPTPKSEIFWHLRTCGSEVRRRREVQSVVGTRVIRHTTTTPCVTRHGVLWVVQGARSVHSSFQRQFSAFRIPNKEALPLTLFIPSIPSSPYPLQNARVPSLLATTVQLLSARGARVCNYIFHFCFYFPADRKMRVELICRKRNSVLVLRMWLRV